MGNGHDKHEVSEAEMDGSLHQEVVPLPKLPAAPQGVQVAVAKTPTSRDVLDPEHASMKGQDAAVVVDSLTELVETIYQKVFLDVLNMDRAQLAELTPPVEEPEWALKLVETTVTILSNLALAEVGALAASALSVPSTIAKLGTASNNAVGKGSGDWIRGKAKGNPAPQEEPTVARPVVAGGALVDEFLVRTRDELLGKRHDAANVLRIIKASAAKQNPDELADLDGRLNAAISSGELRRWFRENLAIHWANCIAKLSFGPPKAGKTTNLVGANTIGGWHESGAEATTQWRGAHDGVIDVVVDVSSSAPAMVSADVYNHPGVGRMLQAMGVEQDADGSNYTLASLPMFKRVWLSRGSSKLEVTPAFLVTPEGALEINFDDPSLAIVGGAVLNSDASSYDAAPEGPRNSPAWNERTTRAAYAVAGANRLMLTVLKNPNDVKKLRGI